MDLNLIRVFNTIYETQSITECAKLLHVTQPSISYSLKKLRLKFNDELFIRHNILMLPTAKAQKIYQTFKLVLHQIDHVISQEEVFDIASYKGNIKIAVSDLGASFFIPFIYEKITQHAPHIRLDVIQLDNQTIKNSMLNGEVDVCICNKISYLDNLFFDTILRDEYIGIMDKSQDYCEDELHHLSFISVSSHAGHQRIEECMNMEGLKIKLSVPNFNLLENVIKNKNHIAIVPYTLTKHLHSDIKIIDLPFDLPMLEIGIYRNQYSINNNFCTWMVNQISSEKWYY